jgi:hypothetical protein
LEERSKDVKELKELLKKERAERGGRRTFAPSPANYCWSQGYKVARSHTSQTCTLPKDGHKREATKNNNMDGSQANKEWYAGVTSLNNSEKFEDCHTPPILDHHETATLYSGCTLHFLFINATCHNNIKSLNPLRVIFPNGETMESMQTTYVDIPGLGELKIAEANNVYELRNAGALVNYLHKAMFSPTKSALLQAVKKVTSQLGQG